MIFLLLQGGLEHNTDISLHSNTVIQATNLRVFAYTSRKINTFLAICGKHFLHTSFFLFQTGRCFAERFDFLGVNHFASTKSYLIFVHYFYVCTVHLVYGFYFNQQCTIHIFFYFSYIYIIITLTCIDTFLSSSGSSTVVLR